MFEWKPEGEKIVAIVEHVKITLEQAAEDRFLAIVTVGTAKLSTTAGATQEAVRHTVEKRVKALLLVGRGECEDCGGATYPYRGGPKRCLTPGCKLYKKKVLD